MEFFFNPKSVAIIGASERGVGINLVTNALLSMDRDAIYPVNPRYETICGLKAYPTVDAIEADVDMAMVMVPAPILPEALEACARKGIGGVIIQSAGFAETGDEGRKLQARCVEIARANNMRLWGPNCMGMVDIPNKRFFTFMDHNIKIDLSMAGGVSLVVQSGMLSAGFLVDQTYRRHMGVSKACSIGNKCDIDESDVLEYLLADPDTTSVGLYLESIGNGRRFLDLISGAAKPVVVLKAGRSVSGAKAAISHTASLAGNARLTDSLLREAGALLAHDFNHMFDIADTAAMIPKAKPNANIAVVAFSGGAGILSCDVLEANGLQLATLTPETIAEMEKIYPPWMPPANPMDLYPAMEKVGFTQGLNYAMHAAIADPNVDGVLVHSISLWEDFGLEFAEVQEKAKAAGKFMAVWCFGMPDSYCRVKKYLNSLGIPVFDELSRLSSCVAEAAKFNPQAAEKVPPVAISSPSAGPAETLDEIASKGLLAQTGIPVVADHLADSVDQAVRLASDLGYPVALKGILPDVVHKTELGLVQPNVANEQDLRRLAEDMQKRMDGKGKLLVQQRVSADYELMAGMVRDDQFGPCVMLGMGGQLAELRPDITFAMAPLSTDRALAMLDRLESRKLFDGFRKLPPLDRAAMADLLVKLAELGANRPDISQIDINPVLISGGKPVAVDASVIMG